MSHVTSPTPELTFQKDIVDFLIREHTHGKL